MTVPNFSQFFAAEQLHQNQKLFFLPHVLLVRTEETDIKVKKYLA